ncbi:DUF6344 domain-containing protein [Streptomyces sp. G45]|uniref:DUF6344 domain-containing protein n=1 Tax=Streptomyces sp. G45 TaxID=3406627 RepID=UPI003C1AFAF5
MLAIQATKLWTTLVSAVLALFAALGFGPAAAAAPVQQATTTCEGTTDTRDTTGTTSVTAPVLAAWTAAYERSLPPTMKQRIRAEAHGATPSCRHLPSTDAEASADTGALTGASLAAEP